MNSPSAEVFWEILLAQQGIRSEEGRCIETLTIPDR